MILTVDRMPQKATLIELCEALQESLDLLDYEDAKKIASLSRDVVGSLVLGEKAPYALANLRHTIEQVFETS
jgi:hypothetical protein